MLELEVNIPDKPGALIKTIQPLSNHGANIHGIFHHHDKKTKDNLIPVLVTFDLSDPTGKALEQIQADLRQQDVHIVRITTEIYQEIFKVISVGHVFDTDIVDTIKRITEPGVHVKGIQAEFMGIEDVSTVKFAIELADVSLKLRVMEKLGAIAEEKGLFLIPQEEE